MDAPSTLGLCCPLWGKTERIYCRAWCFAFHGTASLSDETSVSFSSIFLHPQAVDPLREGRGFPVLPAALRHRKKTGVPFFLAFWLLLFLDSYNYLKVSNFPNSC